MTLYTSSSNQKSRVSLRHFALFGATALMVMAGLLIIELSVRRSEAKAAVSSSNVQELMAAMPHMRISGREIGNQMLVHNVALFSKHPAREAVSVGYVGTSRSKVLRPGFFGLSNSVVGAGNTYNEVSYGLLAQAEILRLEFPRLKRIYVESSFLLRRPGRLIVEPDHQKYLPIVASFSPLCGQAIKKSGCKKVFDELKTTLSSKDSTAGIEYDRSALWTERGRLRLVSLFAKEPKSGVEGIPVLQDSWLKDLDYNGERKTVPRALVAKEDQVMEITNDNVKVQRLRDIASNAPWDGLFDLFAVWGKDHGIEVIFFQPPVRSDLYSFQKKFGIEEHVADLQRISADYHVGYVDLNLPELGYMSDWELFSDEDHMETCVGSGLLTLALELGRQEVEKGNYLPRIPRKTVDSAMGDRLKRVCH